MEQRDASLAGLEKRTRPIWRRKDRILVPEHR
jgi:hypothetical protein